MSRLLIEGGTLLGLADRKRHPARDGPLRGGRTIRAAGTRPPARRGRRGAGRAAGRAREVGAARLRAGPPPPLPDAPAQRTRGPGAPAVAADATSGRGSRPRRRDDGRFPRALGSPSASPAGSPPSSTWAPSAIPTRSSRRRRARGIRYAGGNVLMDDPETTPPNLRASAEEGLAETERLHGPLPRRGRTADCASPCSRVSRSAARTCCCARAAEFACGARASSSIRTRSENRGEVRSRAAAHGPGQRCLPRMRSGLLTEHGPASRTRSTRTRRTWDAPARRGGRAWRTAPRPTCGSLPESARSATCAAPACAWRLARTARPVTTRSTRSGRCGWPVSCRGPARRRNGSRLSRRLRMATWDGSRALGLPGPEGLAARRARGPRDPGSGGGLVASRRLVRRALRRDRLLDEPGERLGDRRGRRSSATRAGDSDVSRRSEASPAADGTK